MYIYISFNRNNNVLWHGFCMFSLTMAYVAYDAPLFGYMLCTTPTGGRSNYATPLLMN